VFATTPAPAIQSWSDAEHGWRAGGAGVQATTDGGKHWRVVFRFGPDGGERVDALITTSPRAGIVELAYGTYVTADGGSHWYLVASAPDVRSMLGHGSVLYAVQDGVIDRAVQWPLRNLRCHGRWFHQIAGDLDDVGPKPRTICLEDKGVDIRTRTVFRLPEPTDGTYDGLFGQALIPGGVIAGVYDITAEPHSVPFLHELIWRNGVATYRDLPGADGARAFVDWPRIALVSATTTWTSDDGGQTWATR
jgi:hypothetical protein